MDGASPDQSETSTGSSVRLDCILAPNQSKLSKNWDTKLLISKLRTKKSSDWSNANSLKLFTHPLHARYSLCLLQVLPFAFCL